MTATITTNTSTAAFTPVRHSDMLSGLVLASLLPFGSLLLFRRRKSAPILRLACVAAVVTLSLAATGGCGDGKSSANAPAPVTPAGTSNVVITATSGAIAQQATVALTVK